MDTYSAFRHFADSWGLLAMFLFFVGMVLWVFRPGASTSQRDTASIVLRDDKPGHRESDADPDDLKKTETA
ncbi:MAG: CcoQ/FixQ family Cbb3-type cytochrome c oxidase assembly chaperone [Rhodobacteraceae bacterium]|nr:CcoQ/FixQ family Cbb3-type cytochrome c oxidase assembly chaperone [Paracoccaceae bacterium]QEW19938.1 Cbb3-type cytochrome oxidase, subunit 3 [Marinibacterium anthonyi]